MAKVGGGNQLQEAQLEFHWVPVLKVYLFALHDLCQDKKCFRGKFTKAEGREDIH